MDKKAYIEALNKLGIESHQWEVFNRVCNYHYELGRSDMLKDILKAGELPKANE